MKDKQFIAVLGAALCLSVPSASADQFDVGMSAFDRGDYAAAVQVWRPMAEDGNAKAQLELGLLYAKKLYIFTDTPDSGGVPANGQKEPLDYSEAVKWLRMAAEQGNSDAQNALAGMYLDGLGVPQDVAEAVKWFRMAGGQ